MGPDGVSVCGEGREPGITDVVDRALQPAHGLLERRYWLSGGFGFLRPGAPCADLAGDRRPPVLAGFELRVSSGSESCHGLTQWRQSLLNVVGQLSQLGWPFFVGIRGPTSPRAKAHPRVGARPRLRPPRPPAH